MLKMYNLWYVSARLNGSHNTLEWHSKTIRLIKTIPDCPILLDIPEKIRTVRLDIEPVFKKNDILILLHKAVLKVIRKYQLLITRYISF